MSTVQNVTRLVNGTGEAAGESRVSENVETMPQNRDANGNQFAEDDEDDEDHTDDEDAEYQILFNPLIDLIISKTAEAKERQPPATANRKDHETYWRKIFSDLQERVASDDSIPQFLTKPRMKELRLTVVSGRMYGPCACCLPDNFPTITIAAEEGVTKTNLLTSICDTLYGDARVIGKPEDLPVIKAFDWMIEATDRLYGVGEYARRAWMYVDGLSLDDGK